MATNAELSQTVHSWIRRFRWQRALIWASRGFILGLALSLGSGFLGIYQAKLLRDEFLTLLISISVLVPLLSGSIAFLWPIAPLKAARTFDRIFHLQERVSTALELSQRPEPGSAEMIDRQLQDAVTAARRVNPRRDLPLRYNLREGLVSLFLIVLMSVVWFRGETWFN
ncbi:MAG TPA: hypothetical protein VFY83_07170, partial [Anaerolineales bacterium]|nr:hypothetical protein [Anaerolineales bacterium]